MQQSPPQHQDAYFSFTVPPKSHSTTIYNNNNNNYPNHHHHHQTQSKSINNLSSLQPPPPLTINTSFQQSSSSTSQPILNIPINNHHHKTTLEPIHHDLPLYLDLLNRSPSGDSISTPSSIINHQRPSTSTGQFAFNLPTTPNNRSQLSSSFTNHHKRPISSNGLNSTTPTNSTSSSSTTSSSLTSNPLTHQNIHNLLSNYPTNQTPPLSRPIARLSLSNQSSSATTNTNTNTPNSFSLLSAPSTSFQYGIGPHNTRPMTAPGAGWDAGQFNHDYDYTSASVGLYGNGQLVSPDHLGESPEICSNNSRPTTTCATNFSSLSPDLSQSDQFLSLFPNFLSPPSTTTSIRPQTHSGTPTMGFGEHQGTATGGYPSNPLSIHDWRPNTSALGLEPSQKLSSSFHHPSYPSSAHHHSLPRLSIDSITSTHLSSSSPVTSSATSLETVHQLLPHHIPRHDSQPYHFNLLPGAPRKRARRRFDEVERLYDCNYPGCTKGYGTLNHLNAHIAMQKHGPKRLPQEFKEIRKEWRAKKKAEAEARNHNRLSNPSH